MSQSKVAKIENRCLRALVRVRKKSRWAENEVALGARVAMVERYVTAEGQAALIDPKAGSHVSGG